MKSIFIVFVFLSFYSCQSTDLKVLKLGHSLNTDHSVHIAMEKLAKSIDDKSDGKLKVEIYPNQQLGTERQCLELLQIGSLDMTKVSVGVMENFVPEMKVLGLPYIFRDKEHCFSILDGPIGQDLLKGGSEFWLRGLGYYYAGSRSFYTIEKPVMTPADLSGMKIRVMESVTAMDMVRMMGGSPTPISGGEIYSALQQGVVEGAENNPTTFYLSKHYEICKYFALDEHTTLPDVLAISIHTWNKLTDIEKEWLKDAVWESVVYQRALWDEAELEALEAVQEAGVEIFNPDKKLFKEKIKSVYSSYDSQESMAILIDGIINQN